MPPSDRDSATRVRGMVLCAGLGGRLRPLTETCPKPLLPLGDRPLLEHALSALTRVGIAGPIVLNVHHLAEAFDRRRATLSREVTLVHEAELRGTAGGVAGARQEFQGSAVLVMIGDVALQEIPATFLDEAAAGGMCLLAAPRALGSGNLGLSAMGDVVRLRGERFGMEVASAEYLGCALLGPGVIAELPDEGCLVGDVALPLLRRGERVRTHACVSEFVLPGDDLQGFWSSNLAWLAQRGASAFVGEGADIEPSIGLERSLVGAGARVSGHGALREVVVLPGASCSAPLERAIVGADGCVVHV